MLRVRTGPECPEGNQRELTRDSNLNCGIARERINLGKVLNLGTTHAFPEQRTERIPEKSWPAVDWPIPFQRPEAGGREKGQTWPQRWHPAPNGKQASSF